MSKQLNHIDQYINRALKNYEVPLNTDDWEVMNKQLDKSFGKSTAIIWSLKCFKFIAVAAVILSALYGFKFVVNENAESPINNTNTTITASATNKDSNNDKHNHTNTTITASATNKDSNNDKHSHNNTKQNFNTNPTITKTLKDSKQQKENSSLEKTNIKNTATNSQITTPIVEMPSTRFGAGIKNKDKQNLVSASPNTSASKTEIQNHRISQPSKEQVKIIVTTPINTPKKININQHNKTSLVPSVAAISTSPKNKKEWVGVNNLTTISPSTITNNKTIIAAANINVPKVTAVNTATSKWSIGVHTGTKKVWADINNMQAGINSNVAITAKVHPLIAIETGATYWQQKIRSANLDDITVNPVSTVSIAQQEQQQGNFFKLVNSKIKTLEIPLLAKLFMRSPQKKLVPYVAAGPSIQFKLKEQYYYEYKDRDGTILSDVGSVDIKQDDKIARQWAMANINTGLNYHISKHISLQLEGQAQMSIKKYLIDRTMLHRNVTVNPNQRIYALGVHVGLNYHF